MTNFTLFLSSLTIRFHSKNIVQEALGVKVNGKVINNIRFVDDTVLIAETLEELQRLMDLVVQTSEERGLTLNTKKTKFIAFTKQQNNSEKHCGLEESRWRRSANTNT